MLFMKRHLIAIVLMLYVFSAFAQDQPVSASPKPGWGDFQVVEEDTSVSWWEEVLLWPINRILDLLDVFRVDVGVGGAYGGVLRLTEYGQAGYRQMAPGSLRVGLFGRDWPVLVETSNEIGAGPAFVQSKDRKICSTEIGVGVDLIAGGYGGICLEELVDFVGGVFFLDMKDDDLR